MTRYALLKLIRRLVEALPGWRDTWMPRDGARDTLFVFFEGGRRFEITIKETSLQKRREAFGKKVKDE